MINAMNVSSIDTTQIGGSSELLKGGGTAASPQEPGLSFSKMLDALDQSQEESDTLVRKLAAGEDVDLHQVMIASEQNDISFRVALSIRDKLVEAYREVMRMAV